MSCDLSVTVPTALDPNCFTRLAGPEIEKIMAKRLELIEGLLSVAIKESGYEPQQLTLYETATPGMPYTVTWRVGVDHEWTPAARKSTIIQEFLDQAEAHFSAELTRLQHAATGDLYTASQKKAIEGARWTAFHTRTLSKYLKEQIANGSIK